MKRSTLLVIGGGAVALAAAVVVSLTLGRPADPRGAVLAGEPTPLDVATPPGDPWVKHPDAPQATIVYSRFETVGEAEGLPWERTTAIVVEGDDLYVGTEEGFAERRAGKWRAWSEKEGLPHRYVTSVARDPAADVTWVTTLRGVSRIAGGAVENFTQRSSGLMNDVVYQAVVDGPRVWFGTGAGTSVYDTRTGSWSAFDHENSIMHEPWCYSVALGPDRAWIGLWGGCCAELNRRDGSWREYRDPDGEMELDLLPDDGPIHDVTSFVAYDSGYLWLASYFGLTRYDGRRWKTFTLKDQGLAGDFITQVAARGDACWVASDQGMSVVRGDRVVTYLRQEDGTCRVRTSLGTRVEEEHVLPTAPADTVVQWVFPRDGDAWIATPRGLSRAVVQTK